MATSLLLFGSFLGMSLGATATTTVNHGGAVSPSTTAQPRITEGEIMAQPFSRNRCEDLWNEYWQKVEAGVPATPPNC